MSSRGLLLAAMAASLLGAGTMSGGLMYDPHFGRMPAASPERLRRHRERKPYQGKIGTPSADTRDDKYLHAAARRRRQEGQG